MKEPQEANALILVNGTLVLRRHPDGYWLNLDGDMDSRVDWSFLEHKAAEVVRLQEGDAGPVLREEWGYLLRPEGKRVAICGFREQAEAAMAEVAGQRFTGSDGADFTAAPLLRHRYYTDWLDPDDE
jgi:hypothetical protein